jgi:hypothetical protein
VVARAQEILGTLEVQTAPRARGGRGRGGAVDTMPLFAQRPGDPRTEETDA